LRREHGGEADRLTLTVKDPDKEIAGRGFFTAVAGTALAGYPGLYLEHASAKATEYGVYWPALIPADEVTATAVLADGTRLPVPRPPLVTGSGTAAVAGTAIAGPPPAAVPPLPVPPPSAVPETGAPRPETPAATTAGRTVRLPLGTLVGARSGDKGGDANVGLWAKDDRVYAWLRDHLDVARLRALLPETAKLSVSRYELPNLRALNFVVHGLLGDGVASSTSADPQAKALGERLRGCLADVPEDLVDLLQSQYTSLPNR
jgi:hypothetical protein